MRTLISALPLICLLFFSGLTAQTISENDSLEITGIIADWNQGWKIKDHLLATRDYSEEAEFTNAFGHNRRSKVEIEGLLEEVFQLDFVMSGDSQVASQRLIRISPEVILAVTQIERAGQKDPQGKALGMRHTNHHRLFRKDNGSWKIVSHLISDARDTSTGKQ